MISSKIYLKPLNVPFTPQDKLRSSTLPPVSGADAQRSANGAKGSGGSFERGGSDVAANSVVILLDGARCHFSLQLFGRNQERKTKVTVYYTYVLMEGVYTCDMCYTNMFHIFSGGFICQSVDKVERTVKHAQCIGSIYPSLVTVANQGFV